MDLLDRPPQNWDVDAPRVTAGFARAMTTMGFQPLFLHGSAGSALALIRGEVPVFGKLAARAQLYAAGIDRALIREAVAALARRGIPTVKVGDTMWGVPWNELGPDWPFPRTRVRPRHTLILDLSQDERTLRKNMEGADRKIRKAENEGVKVREATGPEDIAAYCRLSQDTSERVRRRTAFTQFPDALFHTVFREMAPSGAARFYLAWDEDRPLAGCIFLCSRDTMLYWRGGSHRDRALTAKQAPAAVFWHAIRAAQAEGLRWFDFGGCTPSDDPSDPGYGVYAFKKRWGGRLETFYNLEVVLSAPQHFFQERVLSPLWDRLHPLYFSFMHRRNARS